MENNKVFVSGEVLNVPTFSHETFDEEFYECDLKIKRLSDSFDIIPITISKKLLDDFNVEKGDTVSCEGQFRSYNKQIDGKSKLMLTIFVRELVETVKDNFNNIEITGFICKEPIYRTTPFNREICDVLLAVNRNFNKSDYIPCIAWGKNARFIKKFAVGDRVRVLGRIQSREYQKRMEDETVVSKVAYEVSISKIITDKSLEFVCAGINIKNNTEPIAQGFN